MPRTIAFRSERRSENFNMVSHFLVSDKVQNAELAIRTAVAKYLESPLGQRALAYSGGDFNWGDALSNIPADFWASHGLQPLDIEEIVVNHDEVLFHGDLPQEDDD